MNAKKTDTFSLPTSRDTYKKHQTHLKVQDRCVTWDKDNTFSFFLWTWEKNTFLSMHSQGSLSQRLVWSAASLPVTFNTFKALGLSSRGNKKGNLFSRLLHATGQSTCKDKPKRSCKSRKQLIRIDGKKLKILYKWTEERRKKNMRVIMYNRLHFLFTNSFLYWLKTQLPYQLTFLFN